MNFRDIDNHLAYDTSIGIESFYSFDDMNLNESLLRSIYLYGFEKPSEIQQRTIVPIYKKKKFNNSLSNWNW